MKRIIVFLLLFNALNYISIVSYANDCTNTEKKCINPDKSFKISSSSRSIKMRKGKKVRIVLNAYGSKEYFFSTYSKAKVGNIQFKIINANNQVLYDNSSEGLTDNKSVKIMNTQKLYLDLTIPNWKSDNLYECAGFKIAYRNISSF